jgi:hypothetical protein
LAVGTSDHPEQPPEAAPAHRRTGHHLVTSEGTMTDTGPNPATAGRTHPTAILRTR